jgi:hypothetical protein
LPKRDAALQYGVQIGEKYEVKIFSVAIGKKGLEKR